MYFGGIASLSKKSLSELISREAAMELVDAIAGISFPIIRRLY
jgi:hypothetical protein